MTLVRVICVTSNDDVFFTLLDGGVLFYEGI